MSKRKQHFICIHGDSLDGPSDNIYLQFKTGKCKVDLNLEAHSDGESNAMIQFRTGVQGEDILSDLYTHHVDDNLFTPTLSTVSKVKAFIRADPPWDMIVVGKMSIDNNMSFSLQPETKYLISLSNMGNTKTSILIKLKWSEQYD